MKSKVISESVMEIFEVSKEATVLTCALVIVAFDETTNSVLGMSNCSVRNSDKGYRFGYISNLIVKEEKRRTGIGEEIIRHIIEYFKTRHIHSIRLALNSNVEGAAKILFTKLGFEEILRIYELKI